MKQSTEKGTVSNRKVVIDFYFVGLTINRIGSENVARNKAFILANLTHIHNVIVEKTRALFTYKVSKYCI